METAVSFLDVSSRLRANHLKRFINAIKDLFFINLLMERFKYLDLKQTNGCPIHHKEAIGFCFDLDRCFCINCKISGQLCYDGIWRTEDKPSKSFIYFEDFNLSNERTDPFTEEEVAKFQEYAMEIEYINDVLANKEEYRKRTRNAVAELAIIIGNAIASTSTVLMRESLLKIMALIVSCDHNEIRDDFMRVEVDLRNIGEKLRKFYLTEPVRNLVSRHYKVITDRQMCRRVSKDYRYTINGVQIKNETKSAIITWCQKTIFVTGKENGLEIICGQSKTLVPFDINLNIRRFIYFIQDKKINRLDLENELKDVITTSIEPLRIISTYETNVELMVYFSDGKVRYQKPDGDEWIDLNLALAAVLTTGDKQPVAYIGSTFFPNDLDRGVLITNRGKIYRHKNKELKLLDDEIIAIDYSFDQPDKFCVYTKDCAVYGSMLI